MSVTEMMMGLWRLKADFTHEFATASTLSMGFLAVVSISRKNS
jgi:hypothetical protein